MSDGHAFNLDQRARELTPSRPLAFVQAMTPLVVGLLLALLLHRFGKAMLGDYGDRIAADIGINVVLAVSLTIVNGFTGQFSIGHAGFAAIGGYVAGFITYYGSFRLWDDAAFHAGYLSWTLDPAKFEGAWFTPGDLLFVGALIAGGLVAAVFGLIVGLPSLRLRGDYLAIVTLGFGEIVRVVIESTRPTLSDADRIRDTPLHKLLNRIGGPMGFDGLPFYASQFWVWTAVALTVIAAHRIKRSTLGRAFLAIRENEIAAAAMGVPVTRYKVRAFVVAAFFAGVAGGLFAHKVGILNPSELDYKKSFDIIIMVVLGGLGSISGAIVAAGVVTVLPELLRDPPHVWHVALVVAAVTLAVRRRRGVTPALILLAVAGALEGLRAWALSRGLNLADYRMILYALALILMMLLRPQGIFGIREAWELLPRKSKT